MPKVFDCFMFLNELSLLEARLNILDSCVDFFVISESEYTHSGSSKPLNFLQNRDRFKKWMHKIIYISSPSIINKNDYWKNENFQRNQIILGLNKAENDDIIIISDIDEIPNLRNFNFNQIEDKKIYGSKQNIYTYYLNLQSNEPWVGSQLLRYKYLKEIKPQDVRDNRFDCDEYLPEVGWHFSYFGGKEQIKYKLKSFAHKEHKDLEEWKVDFAFEHKIDLFERKDIKYRTASLYELPKYFQENQEKLKEFLI